jgi:proteasome-associated ATPase
VDEVRSDLELHLRHGDLVDKYDLTLLSGLTLVGAPGVGKTLFAKAMANFLAGLGLETRFMHVKPGALRGVYYGQAEARIRELFAVAKSAPGLVVIFFDELDSYGSRGGGIGQDIDGRVLGALLAEIDGLESAANILCIGATNRLDLCDTALVRNGRMGDRVYTIPRPGRQATREILARYLVEELSYREGSAADFVEAATGYLHAAEDGAGSVATVTLRGGDSHEIRARHLLSGALLASAVERAKHSAAQRELESVAAATEMGDEGEEHGLRFEDLFLALDHAIAAEAKKLSAPHVARQMLEIPRAEEIVRVELTVESRIVRHRYLRVA